LVQRLDRFLRRTEPFQSLNLNQAQIESLLRNKKILVNGARATASTRVANQDDVAFAKGFAPQNLIKLNQERASQDAAAGGKYGQAKSSFQYTREDVDFLESLIVYEDDCMMVLNKPAGVAAQGGTGTNYHLDGLLQNYSKVRLKNRPLRLVHRLDRDTSGVFVVAKTLESAAFLAQAFKEQRVEKTYWAIVSGIPQPPVGKIDAPLAKVEIKRAEKMAVDPKNGRRALTNYRLIKAINHKRDQKVGHKSPFQKDMANRTSSWLELCPKTGRTHQLRVHCAHMGHAIDGDSKYGSDVRGKMMLHARQIKIPDYETGRNITIAAEPPEHMVEVFKNNKTDWQKDC